MIPDLPLGLTPLHAILLIPPAAAILLAFIPSYRLGAAINILAAGLTFAFSASLFAAQTTWVRP